MHRIMTTVSDETVSTETTKKDREGFLLALLAVILVALGSGAIGYLISQKQLAESIALTHTMTIQGTGFVCSVMPHE